jgi:class 3 adenylate cyclase/tetratricopeptide (TPR) repeat protein
VERKLLTILFVDLVDSTALVAANDPEVVRRRVDNFFRHVRESIDLHGGTLGKFAGDGTMAAFGIPVTHEDDADRAVRAGLSILEAVPELGLEARIGVEAGEILTDEDDITFATGEAINVAVRLQQAASPGQLLLGPSAHRLTLGRLETEELGPLQLKGLERPVWAWRAVCRVDQRPRATSLVVPLVAREPELELLQNTFDRVVRDQRAHVFTVYGEPGVGKSRLVREFVAGLEGSTILTGRCLPYGEGITYWPLAEMVKVAAGISDDDPVKEAVDKLRKFCEDEAVADLLGLASGVLEAVEEERSQQEIAWAAKAWIEQLAQTQPMTLVFEDVHWGEDPLLELIEQLATLRDAPILILCLARPELLETHPRWGAGRLRATAIELEPLAPDESEELIDALLRGQDLDHGARTTLLEKTGGNPLFLEETVRMLQESGDGVVDRIPDTVQALIAARIDRLGSEEKLLLQRAAVIGRVFWRGALEHLSTGLDVAGLLDSLLEREFVVAEERSSLAGDRAFQFKHVLIREVAYSSISKAQRADDHRRFAEWIASHTSGELAEIRAHHLDRATALVVELEGVVPDDLAHEAAGALEEAGRRSLGRESFPTARRMLLRANELEASLIRRYLAARAAFRMSDFDAATDELSRVRADAREAGDGAIEGRALLSLATGVLNRDADVAEARLLAGEAASVLDPGDDRGHYDAHLMLARIGWWIGDLTMVENHSASTLSIARRLRRPDLEAHSVSDLAHVRCSLDDYAEARRLFDEALELAEKSGSLEVRGDILTRVGQLELERGNFDRALASVEEARALFEEIGSTAKAAWALVTQGEVALVADDLDRAEKALRDAMRVLSPLRQRGNLAEAQRQLGEVMLRRGRIEEAERYAVAAMETVGREDLWSRALTLSVLALVRAEQGRQDEAESLLRDAATIAEATDYVALQRRVQQRLDAFRHGEVTAPAQP